MRLLRLPACLLSALLFTAPFLLVAPTPVQAQDIACAVAAPGTPPEIEERMEDLRRIATGRGVTVAVIDTGVARHPELDQLRPGADFVSPDEPRPFQDCDVHGTVVAGIIAGTTVGIAPDAEIVTIRQSSAHFRTPPPRPKPEDNEEKKDERPEAEQVKVSGAGNLQTLTHAIHNAIDERAKVINISVVSCVEPALAPRVDTAGLRHALGRAEHEGVVVVAAAGNATADCPPGSTVFPAHFPTVLTVGARADAHTVADYSLPVPDDKTLLSAAGQPGVAVSASGRGWAEGVAGDRGSVHPFEGTSFAAPVVSGTAALLRQRYPHASAARIRAIIEASSEPSGGAVDPFAAVTYVEVEEIEETDPLRVAPAEHDVLHAPRRTGLALTALALLIATTLLAGAVVRSTRAAGWSTRVPRLRSRSHTSR